MTLVKAPSLSRENIDNWVPACKYICKPQYSVNYWDERVLRMDPHFFSFYFTTGTYLSCDTFLPMWVTMTHPSLSHMSHYDSLPWVTMTPTYGSLLAHHDSLWVMFCDLLSRVSCLFSTTGNTPKKATSQNGSHTTELTVWHLSTKIDTSELRY